MVVETRRLKVAEGPHLTATQACCGSQDRKSERVNVMSKSSSHGTKSRQGFTMIELVVVVLIVGIMAAIAVPRMSANATTAKQNSAKQSLATVRNAIELYKADNSSYPPDNTTLVTVLKPYLKGPFPAAPLGANAGSTSIAAGIDPAGVVTGTAGWAYTAATGDFYLNDASGLTW